MKKALSFALVICLLCTAFCTPASAATFTDVPDGAWYNKAVNFCAENSYMTGIGGGKFNPGGNVTRAQMAQILYNFSNQPDMSDAENPFSDVKRDAWYANAVLFCKSTDIVSGTSATTYSPNAYVTREQVCKMLYGYYAKSTDTTPSVDLSVLNSYTDKAKISNWAQDSVAWAIQNKIMSGTGNSKLDPKGTCTRAQLAQFICNYYNAFGEILPIVPDEEPDPDDTIIKELIGDTQPLPKDWLPVGGYWQGDRKYNMYGIDVTDVDGIPTAEEAKFIKLNNEYRNSKGLPSIPWNQHAQILAEVRAQEMAYIYGNKHTSVGGSYTTPHVRADGTSPDQCESDIGFQHLSTPNYYLIEELKIDELMIDADMVNAKKTINQGQLAHQHWLDENAALGAQSPEKHLERWQNSTGHNATLLDDMTRWGENAYCAFAYGKDPITGKTTASYNAYAINWIAKQSGEVITDIPVDNANEWTPDGRINWDNLGFTLDEIPEDTSAYEFTKWMAGQNIQTTNKLYAPLFAAWTYNRSFDNIIRDQFKDYYMVENRNPSKDDLINLDYESMSMVKHMCVVAVGDKLVNGHISTSSDVYGPCKACGVNHENGYETGRQFVDQWFMDTYDLDVSGIGNANSPCTEIATGERFDAYSDRYFATASEMKWQEWLTQFRQDF